MTSKHSRLLIIILPIRDNCTFYILFLISSCKRLPIVSSVALAIYFPRRIYNNWLLPLLRSRTCAADGTRVTSLVIYLGMSSFSIVILCKCRRRLYMRQPMSGQKHTLEKLPTLSSKVVSSSFVILVPYRYLQFLQNKTFLFMIDQFFNS